MAWWFAIDRFCDLQSLRFPATPAHSDPCADLLLLVCFVEVAVHVPAGGGFARGPAGGSAQKPPRVDQIGEQLKHPLY